MRRLFWRRSSPSQDSSWHEPATTQLFRFRPSGDLSYHERWQESLPLMGDTNEWQIRWIDAFCDSKTRSASRTLAILLGCSRRPTFSVSKHMTARMLQGTSLLHFLLSNAMTLFVRREPSKTASGDRKEPDHSTTNMQHGLLVGTGGFDRARCLATYAGSGSVTRCLQMAQGDVMDSLAC
jgi:hypothetical protein